VSKRYTWPSEVHQSSGGEWLYGWCRSYHELFPRNQRRKDLTELDQITVKKKKKEYLVTDQKRGKVNAIFVNKVRPGIRGTEEGGEQKESSEGCSVACVHSFDGEKRLTRVKEVRSTVLVSKGRKDKGANGDSFWGRKIVTASSTFLVATRGRSPHPVLLNDKKESNTEGSRTRVCPG